MRQCEYTRCPVSTKTRRVAKVERASHAGIKGDKYGGPSKLGG